MDYPYITLAEVKELDYEPKNALIAGIDLNLIGHFGDIVTLEIRLSDGMVVFNRYNATARIGYLIQCLYDLFELSDENGKRLSEVRNVPCRILCSPDGVVGIGHFMKDRFICEEHFFQYCEKKGEPF